jgi:hypothetical protein
LQARCRFRLIASVSSGEPQMPPADEQQRRTATVLLLDETTEKVRRLRGLFRPA